MGDRRIEHIFTESLGVHARNVAYISMELFVPHLRCQYVRQVLRTTLHPTFTFSLLPIVLTLRVAFKTRRGTSAMRGRIPRVHTNENDRVMSTWASQC